VSHNSKRVSERLASSIGKHSTKHWDISQNKDLTYFHFLSEIHAIVWYYCWWYHKTELRRVIDGSRIWCPRIKRSIAEIQSRVGSSTDLGGAWHIWKDWSMRRNSEAQSPDAAYSHPIVIPRNLLPELWKLTHVWIFSQITSGTIW
jgi:hypothetical protein